MGMHSFLRTISLGNNLSEEQLDILVQSSRKKRYRSGQLVFCEKDESRCFFVVMSGTVKLFKSSPDGKEQTLYLLGPGELFGMCAAFSDSVFSANAMALEESTILIFPGDVLDIMALKDPTILFNMISILSCRLKESMALIEALSLMETPQRVASFLLFSILKKDCREGDNTEIAISRREMSKIIGTAPETLSRVLKMMASEKIISIQGRNIRILDCEELEGMARG